MVFKWLLNHILSDLYRGLDLIFHCREKNLLFLPNDVFLICELHLPSCASNFFLDLLRCKKNVSGCYCILKFYHEWNVRNSASFTFFPHPPVRNFVPSPFLSPPLRCIVNIKLCKILAIGAISNQKIIVEMFIDERHSYCITSAILIRIWYIFSAKFTLIFILIDHALVFRTKSLVE